jgi:hypothetical protein
MQYKKLATVSINFRLKIWIARVLANIRLLQRRMHGRHVFNEDQVNEQLQHETEIEF